MTPKKAYYKCLYDNQDEDLELIIIKSPYYAYLYAKDIKRSRWIEAEDIISTELNCAYWYSRRVIKGKLPENMHNIMMLHCLNNNEWAKRYFHFIKRLDHFVQSKNHP
jgi:hypothetical protein